MKNELRSLNARAPLSFRQRKMPTQSREPAPLQDGLPLAIPAAALANADAAELAFEALRADVVGLGRRRLDALVRQSEQGVGASAPDYSRRSGRWPRSCTRSAANGTASRRIRRLP